VHAQPLFAPLHEIGAGSLTETAYVFKRR